MSASTLISLPYWFPSPFGVLVLKSSWSRCTTRKRARSFRPLSGCSFLNNLRIILSIPTSWFPSPFGVLVLKYRKKYIREYVRGSFRPLSGCSFLNPRSADDCAISCKRAFCGADEFSPALPQFIFAKILCAPCHCSRGADSSISIPHDKAPCNQKFQLYLLSFTA